MSVFIVSRQARDEVADLLAQAREFVEELRGHADLPRSEARRPLRASRRPAPTCRRASASDCPGFGAIGACSPIDAGLTTNLGCPLQDELVVSAGVRAVPRPQESRHRCGRSGPSGPC